MTTPIIVTLAGVIVWFLLNSLELHVLRPDPPDTQDEALATFTLASQILTGHYYRALRNVLALALFYAGVVLTPQPRPDLAISLLLFVGAGLASIDVQKFLTAPLTPAPRPLILLWRISAPLFFVLAIAIYFTASWFTVALTVLPVFVLIASQVLDLRDDITGKRTTRLPFPIPSCCDECGRSEGVAPFEGDDKGQPVLAYLCPTCRTALDPHESEDTTR